jgi:hypothetical protein
VHRATAAKLLNVIAQTSQRGEQHVPMPAVAGKKKKTREKNPETFALFCAALCSC